MTVKPKYYFNLDGNISDGEKEYSLENIEDKIGGLSIGSDLKDNYVLYGRNSLLDLLNNLNDENEQLKKEIISIEKRADKVYDENEQLKKQREELFIRERDTKNDWRELKQENEQLKKENNELRKENYGNLDGLNYYQEQNGHLSSKISDLECENEQLKLLIKKVLETTPIKHSLAIDLKNSIKELYK